MSRWLVMLIGVVCLTAVLSACQSQPQPAQDNSFDHFSPSTGLDGFRATNNTWSPGPGQDTPFPHGFRGF